MKAKSLLPYTALLLAFLALALFEQDYLYRAEEQNLFLGTSLFFKQCMVSSGGLLTWAGAFFTQLFYYPLLGAGVLCLLWGTIMWMLGHTFHIPRPWRTLTLVPVACLLLTITTLGYWIYYLKLRGVFFDATIGTLVALLLVLAYKQLPGNRVVRPLFIVVATAIGYPLFGFYALFAAMLMALSAERLRMVDGLVAVLSVVAVPLLCYHLVYHETNIVNIYWTGLPNFCHVGQRYFIYNLPYIFLFASIAALALLRLPERARKKGMWMQGTVLTATMAAVFLFWYKDSNFHCELTMYRQLEQQQWEEAVATSATVKGEPTRAICIMRNVALARLGRQGDEMYRYPNGASQPAAPFPIRLVDTMGRMLYLEYGITNYCFRWCMEDGVEYGWSVEKLKLMAKCAIVDGEMAAAQKYLSLLKKCAFQKEWVATYTRIAHQPQLIAQHPGLRAISQLQRHDNFLTADQGQMERFLLEHLTTTQTREPLLQEQVLIAAMQKKDARLFWQQFYQYTELHKLDKRPMPRHYQEAACLFAQLGQLDISHMPFDRQVTAEFEGFNSILATSRQRGIGMEQLRKNMYDHFHTTYYYHYYFDTYDYIEN